MKLFLSHLSSLMHCPHSTALLSMSAMAISTLASLAFKSAIAFFLVIFSFPAWMRDLVLWCHPRTKLTRLWYHFVTHLDFLPTLRRYLITFSLLIKSAFLHLPWPPTLAKWPRSPKIWKLEKRALTWELGELLLQELFLVCLQVRTLWAIYRPRLAEWTVGISLILWSLLTL